MSERKQQGYCILVWKGRPADGFLHGGMLYQEPPVDPDAMPLNWWPWQAGIGSPGNRALVARRERVRAIYGDNYQLVWMDAP